MINDCHGHYTTAPKPLRDYRQRQIDSLKDTALTPKAPPVMSDDEIRESLLNNVFFDTCVYHRPGKDEITRMQKVISSAGIRDE